MFCVLGDEKINVGLIAGAGEEGEQRTGMRPCSVQVGSGDQQISWREADAVQNGGKKDLFMSGVFMWIVPK